MNSEKAFVYEIEPEICDLNESNILKPYAYQRLFAQVAEQHLNRVNINIGTTLKGNLAWALVALSIEIIKPVEGCPKLYANTWYSQRKGPFFRRELLFKNEKGETMFHGSTFSILMDVEKRTIYRKKELPFSLTEPIPKYTIEASPTFKTSLEFLKVDERRVYNSYIDRLGHVNNCRYGEFAYDAFSDDERESLNKLKRMDIYFISELRNKDTFSILKAYEANRQLVRGYNNVKNGIAFDIILEFES